MNNYLIEAEVMSRHHLRDVHQSRHSRHHVTPPHPGPRRRVRVAAGLRRMADRLEQ